MRRISLPPRHNWQRIVEAQGFSFHTREDGPYWDESAAYVLTANDVETIESATEDLHQLCLQAAQHIIDHRLFGEMRIPEAAIPLILDSWERETPSVYGRFDLAYDGEGPPKLLEYNAQTPTALFETGAIQWLWKEAVRPRNDQFNSIEPKLQAQWRDCRAYLPGALYFSSLPNDEDRSTVDYLASLAAAEGIATRWISMDQIGWLHGGFVDEVDSPIRSIFALYPWEWLIAEQAGRIGSSFAATVWMEPAWKMLWSNKALLAILWRLFPGHPNLLEAHLDGPHLLSKYVRKPIYSREGANVTVVDFITTAETAGKYGGEGFVYQDLARLARCDGQFSVLGSWYITDQGPAGVGMRGSTGPITDATARFVPHIIE